MSELNKKIDSFILTNPKMLGEVGYYKKVAEVFNVHPEKVRKRWRQLNSKGQALPYSTNGYIHVEHTPIQSGTTTITTSTEDYKTIKDPIKLVDLSKGNISKVKQYNAWIKNNQGEIEVKPLVSIETVYDKKASTIEFDKKLFLDEIKKHSPKTSYEYSDIRIVDYSSKDYALEINIPDLHIGKLAWGKETGEDYDIKIACERYKKAVNELLSRVNLTTLSKIILPVGNDLINVDNAGNTTTAGTAVSCDSRFGKMFQTAKELLVETIDKLVQIAPVDVIIIPGNHDTISTFTLGEVLDAWYHNTPQVTVINTHTPRKYYQYGQNLIMYTHGHREKLNDLGIICATEQPQLWAATKYRRVHVGHFHHSKQIKFTDVQEYPGFTVKILNSLSANDAWHAEKGYISLKAAEAFLYHHDKGLVANYYYMHS